MKFMILSAAVAALFTNMTGAGHAASISADPYPLDFGNVKLYERAELTFEIYPVIDDPNLYLDVWLDIDVSGFWVISQETRFGRNCVGFWDNCIITVGFEPYTVGQYVGSVSARYGIGDSTGDVVGFGGGTLQITGNGVAAVPLPAGAPLLLLGIGGLGLMSRRKRKAA